MNKIIILSLILLFYTNIHANFNENYTPEWAMSASPELNQTFIITLSTLFATSFFFDQSIRNYTQENIYGGGNFFTEFLHGIGDKEPAFYEIAAKIVQFADKTDQEYERHLALRQENREGERREV